MAWELDTAHSLVEFSVKHMMISTAKGRFNTFSGTLDLDEQNPQASSVDVTIDIGSVNTGDLNRDGHLRSADFFDVEHYPTATFTSTRVEPLGDDRYRVYGDLTIRDITHPVTLDVTVEAVIMDLHGKRRAGFSAQTSFNRKVFGLNWNVALETGGVLVSDKVTVNIEAQAVQVVEAVEAETTAASA
jgi:polyisoprenoid-binding protein YceI